MRKNVEIVEVSVEKVVEKEVIVEVPVEKIVEKEVIVEIPVEKKIADSVTEVEARIYKEAFERVCDALSGVAGCKS